MMSKYGLCDLNLNLLGASIVVIIKAPKYSV